MPDGPKLPDNEKGMDISMDKEKVKSIRGLILFTALLILGIIYSENLMGVGTLLIVFLQPFIYGGAIAFVVNIPMKAIEKLLFSKAKGKIAEKLRRPLSLVLSLLAIVFTVTLVIITVVPQIGKTLVEIGNQIPIFLYEATNWLEKQFAAYPQVLSQISQLETLELDWQGIVTSIINFMKNGIGSVLSSTFSVASSIVGGAVNLVISFIFAIYLLSQKEKLSNQASRLLTAYCPNKTHGFITKVLGLLNRNFSNFISGQCLEAVILGLMFVIVMSIFQLPYAVLIGVLIAFTALIPIVGAFIGCAVGVFLILIDDPIKAIWFLILFLIIQQIEGNLIYPQVVGNSVGLPSIWVLVAVSIGGSMLGVVGMLIFIPLTSTAYALIRDDVNHRNISKGIKYSPEPIKEKPKEIDHSNIIKEPKNKEEKNNKK